MRSEAQLAVAVADRLEAWAARHEVSVTAAVEHAVVAYLASGRRPAPRRAGPRRVVRFRLAFRVHQDLRALARAAPAGFSQVVEAAVMGLVAAEGLPFSGPSAPGG